MGCGDNGCRGGASGGREPEVVFAWRPGSFRRVRCGRATMSRPSRLQRQVLSLYRDLLRAGRGKPGAEARVRAEFRQHASLPRSDVLRIEYLYRRGRRQLQLLRSGHATALATFVRPRGPQEEPGDAAARDSPPHGGDAPRRPGEGAEVPESRPDRR